MTTGVLLCLLALAVPVKPLAHVITDCVCCDRHEEHYQDVHSAYLISVAGLEKDSITIMTERVESLAQ